MSISLELSVQPGVCLSPQKLCLLYNSYSRSCLVSLIYAHLVESEYLSIISIIKIKIILINVVLSLPVVTLV